MVDGFPWLCAPGGLEASWSGVQAGTLPPPQIVIYWTSFFFRTSVISCVFSARRSIQSSKRSKLFLFEFTCELRRESCLMSKGSDEQETKNTTFLNRYN